MAFSELQRCYQAMVSAHREARSFALLSIVALEGSGYRGPGTHMVMDEHGALSGALSGGCLEGDLLLQARTCMADNTMRVLRYDTRSDADSVFSLNMGCDGILTILIQPFVHDTADSTKLQRMLVTMERLAHTRHRMMRVLVYESALEEIPFGTEYVIDSIAQIDSLPDVLATEVRRVWNQHRSCACHMSHQQAAVSFLCEVCEAQPVLNIMGAGADAVPLVAIASQIGWRTRVFDVSPLRANQERFPQAEYVGYGDVSDCAQRVIDGENSACILMSHNFNRDYSLFKLLVQRRFDYLGVLGTRARGQSMLEKLEDEGVFLTAAQRSIVHSPVGLDLGAESPEEIALSILSEFLSCLRNGSAESLRSREGRIHSSRA